MEKTDAVIVGGGLAGLSAAYRLAAAGRQVIVLERGDAPGSKNVTGGRIYVEPIRDYLPEIPEINDEAPFERHVVKEIMTLLDDDSSAQFEYTNNRWRNEPFMSYTVLRATFDNWFAEKVTEKGAYVISKKKVDNLLWEDGCVAGVNVGDEEIGARIVIAADGALSFMAEKANMRRPLEPQNYAVAIKEIYKLDEKTIEDRFGLQPDEGAANLYIGSITKGMFGGGFLYTNRDTLSLGLVIGIGSLIRQSKPVEAFRLMEDFSARPEVKRWIKGGELKEYAAHIISEAGVHGIPKLYTGGMLIAGDAAGLSLNLGLTVRGMEFAVASGAIAADVANEALGKGDLSENFLSLYEKKLKESFVLPDMKTFRHSREVLENKRLFTVYPKFLSELLDALFTVGRGPKEPLYRSAKEVAKKHILNWQGFKDLLSLRKM